MLSNKKISRNANNEAFCSLQPCELSASGYLLYVFNKLFVAARTKSSKSHKDVRDFETGLVKLTACSITFRRS